MGAIEMVKNWSTYGECQQMPIEVQILTAATTVLSRLDEIKDITCICDHLREQILTKPAVMEVAYNGDLCCHGI